MTPTMTRELLLMRHGKAYRKAETEDFQRPIKDAGKRAAQRLGVWLARQHLTPNQIVASPAERALVTAQKSAKTMGIPAARIEQDARIYEAGLEALLAVLTDCRPGARRVMLVGHNPGLEALLEYLMDEPAPKLPRGKLLPAAGLARLELPDDWSRLGARCGRLIELAPPKQLPKKFPFPDTDGTEERDRPAYYYTQSSVIPYRLRGGRPEILLIASSKGKHCVLPKGIQDVGYSPRESAAKEAWEEAGIEGEVGAQPLGAYQYPKWGGTCTVAVYPMAVTREIPEEEWEESHRGREWVSPQEAAARLRQAALAPLVLKLAAQLTR